MFRIYQRIMEEQRKICGECQVTKKKKNKREKNKNRKREDRKRKREETQRAAKRCEEHQEALKREKRRKEPGNDAGNIEETQKKSEES